MKDTARIEQYVIDKIREMRKLKGISQKSLSLAIGLSESFIGNVENPELREKYNLRHINEISKVLECSPKDLLPEQPF